MTEIKAFADRYLEKFMSRKLLVWLTTTGLLFAGKLEGEQYVAISLSYIMLQGATDAARQWRHGK